MKKIILLFGIFISLLSCNDKPNSDYVGLDDNAASNSTISSGDTIYDKAKPNVNDKNNSEQQYDSSELTTIEFENTEYDFGTINDKDKVSHYFVFTNTGNKPLINLKVNPTCGCTSQYAPKNPIAPGAKDSIMLEFNPANQPAEFTKTSTVTANIDAPIQLTFRGKIK